MDVINVLAPLNTFAGALTLATQFVLPCTEDTLQALFVLASELYLSSLVALVTVFLLLYGFWDGDTITDYRHTLIIDQFTIIGMSMFAAFIVLEVSIIIAANRAIGIVGLILFCILTLTAGCEAYILYTTHFEVVNRGVVIQDREHAVPVVLTPKQASSLATLFIAEGLCILCLCIVGIWKAVLPDKRDCPNTTVLIPSTTIPMSLVNLPAITSYTLTDLDTLRSFTMTDIDHNGGAKDIATSILTSTATSTISLAVVTINSIFTTTFNPPSVSSTGSSNSECSTTSSFSVPCLPIATLQSSFITSNIIVPRMSTVSCATASG
jgi:hypothetical protein